MSLPHSARWPTLTLTERGRIRAILVTLEQRWDGLSPVQQARALALLAELSAAIRSPETPILREVPVRTG